MKIRAFARNSALRSIKKELNETKYSKRSNNYSEETKSQMTLNSITI